MFLRHNFFGFFWLLFIAAVCLVPGRNTPYTPFFSFDKLFHAVIFGCLTFQLIIGLKKQYTFKRLRYHAVPIAFVFSVCYGIMMEMLQGLILPDRSFDLLDIVANTAGVLAGWVLFEWIFFRIDKTPVRL